MFILLYQFELLSDTLEELNQDQVEPQCDQDFSIGMFLLTVVNILMGSKRFTKVVLQEQALFNTHAV